MVIGFGVEGEERKQQGGHSRTRGDKVHTLVVHTHAGFTYLWLVSPSPPPHLVPRPLHLGPQHCQCPLQRFLCRSLCSLTAGLLGAFALHHELMHLGRASNGGRTQARSRVQKCHVETLGISSMKLHHTLAFSPPAHIPPSSSIPRRPAHTHRLLCPCLSLSPHHPLLAPMDSPVEKTPRALVGPSPHPLPHHIHTPAAASRAPRPEHSPAPKPVLQPAPRPAPHACCTRRSRPPCRRCRGRTGGTLRGAAGSKREGGMVGVRVQPQHPPR